MSTHDPNKISRFKEQTSSPYKNLLDQIANDDLESVVKFLRNDKENRLYSKIFTLSGRLAGLNERVSKGIVSHEDVEISRNKIREDLSSLVQKLQRREENPILTRWIDSFSDEILALLGPVLIIVFSASIYWAITENIYDRTSVTPYPPPKKESLSFTEIPNLSINKFDGIDNQGKSVGYIAYIIRGYSWAKDETEISRKDFEEQNVCDHLIDNGVLARMHQDDLIGIVCFGNASFEEDLSIPSDKRVLFEEERAKERSITLAKCIGKNQKNTTPVYTLNLGKCLEASTNPEAQRQILVVGILQKEPGVVEEEALYEGLRMEYLKGNIEIDISTYSKVQDVQGLTLIRFLG